MNSLRLVRSAHSGVSDVDVRMMERAIRLARQAALDGEVPIAAIVYRGEEILAEAANNRERAADPTGHAEVVAIREAGRKLGEWRLDGCSMAVTLEPCPMCAGAAVNARLGRLVYGATDPKAGACETLYSIPSDVRLNHRVEMFGGVLANQCVELLRAFFRERRAMQKKAKETARAADAVRRSA
jgi:tRNA(adenine34) deaminase